MPVVEDIAVIPWSSFVQTDRGDKEKAMVSFLIDGAAGKASPDEPPPSNGARDYAIRRLGGVGGCLELSRFDACCNRGTFQHDQLF